MVAVNRYDEGAITRAAQALSRGERTAFAAACAERLWPLVERYASAASLAVKDRQVLRDALDAAWRAAGGAGIEEGLRDAGEATEALVPHEDDDWLLESGYAQNGIAAIAYAIRSWLGDDPQDAVWAARQVYEAADYGAQQRQRGAARVYSADVEADLARTAVVQAAIRAISEDLTAVGEFSAEAVRQRACSAAGDFVTLFP